jgi:Ca2+-dependent lipid-binding protein
MQERTVTRKRDEKLSKALAPEDIPARSIQSTEDFYQKSVEEFQSSLEIEPKEGPFFYMRIPAIVFVGTLAGYLVGRLRMSITNVFIIGYIIYFMYRRRIDQFTRSLKSLVYHNTRREKARNVGENAEWLNHIVKKFWEVAEPATSAQIYQQVNTELLKISPPFLTSLKLTEFTLGSRPPFIHDISYMNVEGNTIVLELSLGFVPLETTKDAADYFLSERTNWNSKIQLKARVGTSRGVGISLPVLVKELYLSARARIAINLFSKNTFVKDVEVCLMDPPEFDFKIVPLKTVDIMDVPGLSKWIRNMISSTLAAMVVNPNSITINMDTIAKAQGRTIGVVCLQILSLDNSENERLLAEVDLDGAARFETRYEEGRGIVFNEHFYIIVENIDERIGLSLRSESRSGHRRNGSIFLRNLPLERIEKSKEDVAGLRRSYFNKARLVKDERTYAYLGTNLQFYPIGKERSNSAIVRMTLVGIESLQSSREAKSTTYSTFCTVIVSPINRDKSTVPLGFLQNTVNLTALLVSGVINTAGTVLTNIVPGLGSVTSRLLPSSKSTFYIFESKRIFDNTSPVYNETFTFFSRDISVDVISICVMDDNTNEVIGKVSIPVADIPNNKNRKYKLNGVYSGMAEVIFSMDYVNMVDKATEFIDYTRMMKVSVDSMSDRNVYYLVFETNTDSFASEPFNSGLPVKRAVFVPLEAQDTLRFRLYKETINGDIFVGEDEIDCNSPELPRKEAFLLNEQVSLTLSLEEEQLRDYLGAPQERETVKVMQAKFGEFQKHDSEVFVEFHTKDEMIKASGFTRKGRLNDTFTFVAGSSEVTAVIKRGDQRSNEVVGRCLIPKRTMDETVVLNETGLAVGLQVKVQSCSYRPNSHLKHGYLEIYIKNARELRPAESGAGEVYCQVLLNDSRIFRTLNVRRGQSVTFNESFILKVDRLKDVFGVQIYEYSALEKNALLYYTEFTLHNLSEGFGEMEFVLCDASTFKPTDGRIRLGFNFCADHGTLNVRKRGILGEFFGF